MLTLMKRHLTSAAPGALAIAIAIAAAASGARASSMGYVNTFEGSVSSVETFNSAGGTNTLTILGTGEYEIVLPGLGNSLNSDVQVNAVLTDGRPAICTSQGWTSGNGVDVTAYVGCYDFAGNPAGSDFALLYQSRTAATGGWVGFVWADEPTAASYTPSSDYSYNNRGGVNKITRQGVGVYTVTFPKLEGGGNPQVTAYSGFAGGPAAHCEISNWTATGRPTEVGVRCFGPTGAPADELFDLSYNRASLQSEGYTSGLYAFAFDPVKKRYKPQDHYIESGGLTVTANRFGPIEGQYFLDVANPSGRQPSQVIGMASAVGTAGEYCEPVEIDEFSTDFEFSLFCYDSEERHINLPYSGAMFFEGP